MSSSTSVMAYSNPGTRPPTDIERAFIFAEIYVGISPASYWQRTGRLRVEGNTITVVGDWQPRIGRYRPDFLWQAGTYPLPRYGLVATIARDTVIEVDGYRWHSSPEQLRKDARKDETYRQLGVGVARLWGHIGGSADKIDVLRDPVMAVWAVLKMCAEISHIVG